MKLLQFWWNKIAAVTAKDVCHKLENVVPATFHCEKIENIQQEFKVSSVLQGM